MRKKYLIIIPFFLLALASCRRAKVNNSQTILSTPEEIIVEDNKAIKKKEIQFFNDSNKYKFSNFVIPTYFFDNSVIPYISIGDYINNMSIVTNKLTISHDNDKFSYSVNKNNEKIEMVLDPINDTIEINDYEFVSIDELEYTILDEYKKNLRMETTYELESTTQKIDLSKYNFDIKEVEGKAVIPFHVINTIFSLSSYYFSVYLGDRYVGLSYDDGVYRLKNKYTPTYDLSNEYLEYNYNYIDFMFNEIYGLKEYFNYNISNMLNKYRTKLLDKTKTSTGMLEFIADLNDPHTGVFDVDFFSNNVYYDIQSERYTQILNIRNDLRTRKPYSSYTKISNDTAIIPFDSFYVNEENGANIRIMNQLNECKEDGIKNVVFDVTTNGGGDTFSLAQILGLMTNDDIVLTSTNVKTNSITKETFKVDANYDGDFTDLDAYTEFDYYILSSGYSYSCANEFINYCKTNNLATIIGNRSGGGACSIYPVVLPTGFYFQTSGLCVFLDENGYMTELGIDPDITIDYSKLYDYDSIIEAISRKN